MKKRTHYKLSDLLQLLCLQKFHGGWAMLLLVACFIALPATAGYAQSTTVTGKVVDDQNSGLPGVNVLLKGTTTGTTTDTTNN